MKTFSLIPPADPTTGKLVTEMKYTFPPAVSLSMHKHTYHGERWYQKREIFAGPNFRENPVSPPAEIFRVLIFAFSASY